MAGPSSAAPGLAYDPAKHQACLFATCMLMMNCGYVPAGYDEESGLEETPLVPGMSPVENSLRWGFVRKVFGIVGCQLLLTAVMAAVIMFNEPVAHLVLTNLPLQIIFALAPFVCLIPLYIYKDKYPVNLIILGIFTFFLSISVGAACSAFAPMIVLEAVLLTSAIVGALTVYSFWATKRGKDFTFLGPILYSSLWALVVWGFIQIFFHPGPVGQTIYALLGAFLFSMYIVYDIHLLIARFSLDDWIWASVTLYLDIVNLFLYILQLLGRSQRN